MVRVRVRVSVLRRYSIISIQSQIILEMDYCFDVCTVSHIETKKSAEKCITKKILGYCVIYIKFRR